MQHCRSSHTIADPIYHPPHPSSKPSSIHPSSLSPTWFIIVDLIHHPCHPFSKPSSVHPSSSLKLSVQLAIINPRMPCPIAIFVCVCLCCCWFCFGVIEKILNFLKFRLWLVIFDGLGWGKRLGIWVGIMQPFCLVTEKTKDILIIWLLIEIGFC